jgi:hypothetical protein
MMIVVLRQPLNAGDAAFAARALTRWETVGTVGPACHDHFICQADAVPRDPGHRPLVVWTSSNLAG